MTGRRQQSNYLRRDRKDRLLRELVHDPYKSKRKLPEPTACRGCGAVFQHGRWAWGERPVDAHETLCPACQRIEDKVPASFLTLSGQFLDQHRTEIMNLAHNVEQREKAEHPLKRIMAIEQQNDKTVVTLTDHHLARSIGEALRHAYEGELDFAYTDEDTMLRVSWSR